MIDPPESVHEAALVLADQVIRLENAQASQRAEESRVPSKRLTRIALSHEQATLRAFQGALAGVLTGNIYEYVAADAFVAGQRAEKVARRAGVKVTP